MRATLFSFRLAGGLGLTILTAWSWWTAPRVLVPDWSRAGVTLLESRVYRTTGPRRLTLDVYMPAGASVSTASGRPRPVVLAIHGGSWTGGSKAAYRNDDPRNTLVRLVERGYVAVAADYTQARPGAPSWPVVLDDLREAVRWIRRHAAEFHADPNRLAAMGQSSGGQLAALLGALPDEPGPDGVSSRVQAVVSFYGPSDLARLVATRRLAHEPIRHLLGADGAEGTNLLENASPIHHVSPDDPPVLLLHGTDDDWVPLEQSRAIDRVLTQAGVAHRLIVVPGARHGFEARIGPENDFLPDIVAFLESVWNLSIGEPAARQHGG
jgi:acetyl esterase/lipase